VSDGETRHSDLARALVIHFFRILRIRMYWRNSVGMEQRDGHDKENHAMAFSYVVVVQSLPSLRRVINFPSLAISRPTLETATPVTAQ
jgi:hypothetical protein